MVAASIVLSVETEGGWRSGWNMLVIGIGNHADEMKVKFWSR